MNNKKTTGGIVIYAVMAVQYHTSGFGLGFERLVAYVTGVTNIREVIPFPRTPRNVDF